MYPMTTQTATPTRDRAAYMRAYYEKQRAREAFASPQPDAERDVGAFAPPEVIEAIRVAPLAMPLVRVPKREPERRAVSRPPWHWGDPRPVNGCTRHGDDDWPISPEQDAAMGIRFGRSTPAPVK